MFFSLLFITFVFLPNFRSIMADLDCLQRNTFDAAINPNNPALDWPFPLSDFVVDAVYGLKTNRISTENQENSEVTAEPVPVDIGTDPLDSKTSGT